MTTPAIWSPVRNATQHDWDGWSGMTGSPLLRELENAVDGYWVTLIADEAGFTAVFTADVEFDTAEWESFEMGAEMPFALARHLIETANENLTQVRYCEFELGLARRN